MHRTPLFRSSLAVAAVLAVAACQGDPTPTAPRATPVSPSLQVGQGAGAPSADELDRQIPGFGGFFLDRDGSPTVYITRGNGRGPAERALAGYLSARGLSAAALQVREATYGWQQLQRWQDAATNGAFQIEGTVFVDNDETSNRIRIGVENIGSAGQVRAALARSGLPDDAVIVDQVEPIVQVATLQNVIQTTVTAGVQINFPGYLCSIGFNALGGNPQVASFITASHCTNKQGGTESTPYWQPLESVRSTQVAVEADDPTYKKGAGCPGGRVCRYSDASRAAYIANTGITPGLGQIARTSGANNNSLDIQGTFSITSDDCDGQTQKVGGCLAAGTRVNKVGRTTGWTAGNITNTCVNTGVQGSRIVQLCQTFVSAGVAGGDSGSDVFVIPGNTGTNVQLAGILWGGSSSGSQFVFSPLGNVVSELGPLTTH